MIRSIPRALGLLKFGNPESQIQSKLTLVAPPLPFCAPLRHAIYNPSLPVVPVVPVRIVNRES